MRCFRVFTHVVVSAFLHSFFHFQFLFYVRTMYVLLTSVHTPSSTKTQKHQQRQQRQQVSFIYYRRTLVVIESTGRQYYLERVITTGSRCHH